MATSQQQPAAQPTGVLLRKEIIDREIILEDPCGTCFKPASYDLRIGDDYIDPTDGEQSASLKPLQGKSITIPPFGAMIVSTHEVVKIPGDVIGKFNLRIKMALQGLFVQMGTQVEPHYHGKLFAVLYNITSEPIELFTEGGQDKVGKGRDRLFTIEFFNVGREAENDDPGQKEVVDIRDFVKNTKFSKSTIRAMQQEVERFRGEIHNLGQKISHTEKEIYERLNQQFLGAFQAAQAQVDAAKTIGELKAAGEAESSKRLRELVDGNKEEIGRARSDFDHRLTRVEEKRRHLVWGVILGGFGLAFLSALIPVILGLAVNYTRGWADGDRGEVVLRDVTALRTQLEALTSRLDDVRKIDTLSLEIEALKAEIVALQQQLGYNVEQNGAETPPPPEQ
ncbi:hypothetical protein ACFO5X_12805 [Seohaeicola nanhaiensis]|uniref:dUTPase-like domain-containing protein n=1 Tax=Seohaeicola nanhaiensis TaxID=1387282 RepID=A0ABV9KGY9_9RHOB